MELVTRFCALGARRSSDGKRKWKGTYSDCFHSRHCKLASASEGLAAGFASATAAATMAKEHALQTNGISLK